MFFSIIELIIIAAVIIGTLVFIYRLSTAQKSKPSIRGTLDDADYLYKEAKNTLTDAEKQLLAKEAEAKKQLDEAKNLKEEIQHKKQIIK